MILEPSLRSIHTDKTCYRCMCTEEGDYQGYLDMRTGPGGGVLPLLFREVNTFNGENALL